MAWQGLSVSLRQLLQLLQLSLACGARVLTVPRCPDPRSALVRASKGKSAVRSPPRGSPRRRPSIVVSLGAYRRASGPRCGKKCCKNSRRRLQTRALARYHISSSIPLEPAIGAELCLRLTVGLLSAGEEGEAPGTAAAAEAQLQKLVGEKGEMCFTVWRAL